jgi:hypothetical protein
MQAKSGITVIWIKCFMCVCMCVSGNINMRVALELFWAAACTRSDSMVEFFLAWAAFWTKQGQQISSLTCINGRTTIIHLMCCGYNKHETNHFKWIHCLPHNWKSRQFYELVFGKLFLLLFTISMLNFVRMRAKVRKVNHWMLRLRELV